MLAKFLVVSLMFLAAESQECYGLSLEGGGAKGAYEAGVLFTFANATKGPYIGYNIVTGISIGALNAGLVSQYIIGDELNMAINLVNFWRSLNGSSDIYVEWKGGLIDGLLFQKGIYDNAPSQQLGKIWMKHGPVRNVTVGSTNLDIGILQNFNESIGLAIIDAIIASGSVPFFFPPHDFEGYTWADGGCIINLDVFSAIERCLDITIEKNITIDMIYDDPSTPLPVDTKFKTLTVLERIYQIHSNDRFIWYSYNAMAAYPQVNFRYILIPSEPMGSLLNFSKSALEFDIQLGVKDATAALGNNLSGRTVIGELYNSLRNQVIYP